MNLKSLVSVLALSVFVASCTSQPPPQTVFRLKVFKPDPLRSAPPSAPPAVQTPAPVPPMPQMYEPTEEDVIAEAPKPKSKPKKKKKAHPKVKRHKVAAPEAEVEAEAFSPVPASAPLPPPVFTLMPASEPCMRPPTDTSELQHKMCVASGECLDKSSKK